VGTSRRPPAAALPLVPLAALARFGGVLAERRPVPSPARRTVVAVMDRDGWDSNTDVLVLADAGSRTLTWIPRDLWCEQHGDRVNAAFARGGHLRLLAALAELGFRADASVCLRRAAVERAVGDLTITVPVPERLDLRYPLVPRADIKAAEKVVSFAPPAATLEGERIHQWIGGRYMLGRAGSDLLRLERQGVLVRRLLEEGWDFARVLRDPELVSLSAPEALTPLRSVDARWRLRVASAVEPVTIDGKAALVRRPLSRRIAARVARTSPRARARPSGRRTPRLAASARPGRARGSAAGAPPGPRDEASRGDRRSGPPVGSGRASAPVEAP
jgi:hypothetical protein